MTAAAAPFGGGLPAAATAIVQRRAERRAGALWRGGRARRARPTKQLVLAADQFVIEHDGPTAVAGYPWFGEWSRDLMTSYEGLFLATGRYDEGREALRRAAATVSEGMLANTADTGTLEYNTADGTLWFVHALGRHVAVDRRRRPRRRARARRSRRSSTRHLDGTRFGIGVDGDGLLRQGAEGWALTWMDARIDGVPVTPRVGKPVEVNALWIEALDDRRAARPHRPVATRCTSARKPSFRRPLRARRRRRAARRRRRAGRRRCRRAAEPAARRLAARTARSRATTTRPPARPSPRAGRS